MKSQTIKLTGKKQVDYAAKLINECLDQPELWCVDIKKHKEAKTLQQLGGLFGIWYDYLSDTLGETKDDLHRMHKLGNQHNEGGWLLEIYRNDPVNDAQVIFMNGVYLFEEEIRDRYNDHMMEAYIDHIERISLSWATIDQMREYMKRIEHYYMSAGYPLPILEQYRRAYR